MHALALVGARWRPLEHLHVRLGYKIGVAFGEFPLASIIISGVVTTVALTVLLVSLRRHSRAVPASDSGGRHTTSVSILGFGDISQPSPRSISRKERDSTPALWRLHGVSQTSRWRLRPKELTMPDEEPADPRDPQPTLPLGVSGTPRLMDLRNRRS